MRGSSPSWIACRISEKAPVITAWLAITVATVERTTKGIKAQFGTIRKKGSLTAAGSWITRAP